MKRFALFLVFLCSALCAVAQTARPKVAVVLCGGGAKGAAHVGAIKVIEQAGIPVDMVVGTSMGAIVGGIYAIGYSPAQMDSIIRSQDWDLLLFDQTSRLEHSFWKKEYLGNYFISLPLRKKKANVLSGGVIKGQNVTNLLMRLTIGYHDFSDFNTFPIPFACVAEDVITGDEIVFHEGNLAQAIRSSMSIPGVFAPVQMDGKLLIDGGMCNNFPVDVARQMGADIVIGVDIQNGLKKTKDELSGVIPVLNQVIDLSTAARYRKNVADTDIYIKVNVDGYSAASFSHSAIDTLIRRGEEAALRRLPALDSLRALLRPDTLPVRTYTRPLPDKFYVRNISFEGMDEHDRRVVLRRMRFSGADTLSVADVDRMVSMMRAVWNYASVSYQLLHTEGDLGYNLHFSVKEKTESTANIGLRFDSEEIAAVQMNVTHQLAGKLPLRLFATGRLGKRMGVHLGASWSFGLFSDLNLSYKFFYNDINVNENGKRLYNGTYRNHLVDVNLSNMLFYYRLKFALGLQYENFGYSNFLYKEENLISRKTASFLNYYVRLFYDSLNKKSFPSKGTFFDSEYSFITQNGLHFNQLHPVSAVKAEWRTYIPLTSRFVVVPSVSARVIFGGDAPFPYKNIIGGFVSGRYLRQQLPFAGVKAFEMEENAVFIPSLTLRQRFWKKHYVSLVGNVLFSGDKVTKMFGNKIDYGVSLGYGYDSFFGPLEGRFSYTNRGETFSFYLNLGLNF